MPNERIDILRQQIDETTERLLQVLSERQDLSVAIGVIKTEHGWPLYSEERETELLQRFREDAVHRDLDPDYIEELMRVVLEHSRAAQRRKAGDAS